MKCKLNWRQVLAALDSDLEEITAYLESKLTEAGRDVSRFKKYERKTDGGRAIDYSCHYRDASAAYYTVEFYEPTAEILLNFDVKKIIEGASLADPRAKYETTSAHYYTTKRSKLNKSCKDKEVARKAIDRFFSKGIV